MRRVLLVQPSLQPPGGGNAVAAWMVQALRGHTEISVLTWRGADWTPIDRYFGTALAPDGVLVHAIAPALRRALDLLPTPHAMLRMHALLRRARQLHAARPYDVLCTANNEADFGVPGIQYIHYPWASLPRPATDLRWFHHLPGVLRGYWALCGLLSDFSWPRMRRNVTLVNSAYIAAKVRDLHGIEPIVLHPPVPGAIPVTPWETRQNAFVCIGRLSPEKEQVKVVEILEAVRARGHDVALHLVGTPEGPAYVARLRALARRHAAWMTLHEHVDRDALIALLGRCRFGIHGMVGEHFGIAVAELQRAGCVSFVPAVGGPREIVGPEPRQLYESPADAVAKIDAVLRDPAAARALHVAAVARRDLFTTERFVTRFRDLVLAFEA